MTRAIKSIAVPSRSKLVTSDRCSSTRPSCRKKVKGRKRHIAVDVLGLVLKCHVSAANCADVKVAPLVLFWVLEQYSGIKKI